MCWPNVMAATSPERKAAGKAEGRQKRMRQLGTVEVPRGVYVRAEAGRKPQGGEGRERRRCTQVTRLGGGPPRGGRENRGGQRDAAPKHEAGGAPPRWGRWARITRLPWDPKEAYGSVTLHPSHEASPPLRWVKRLARITRSERGFRQRDAAPKSRGFRRRRCVGRG